MTDLFHDQDLPTALPEHDALLQKWPSRLVEILDHLEYQLGSDLRGSVSPEQISRIAREAVLAIASVAGGRPIYLPAASALRRALRDERLWDAFKGNNYDEISRATGLTESQVRRIINTQQKLQVARRQRSLNL